MTQVSNEEYQKMLAEDKIWAEKIIKAIEDDPRKFVKYKESRPITTIKEMIESSVELFGDNTAFLTKLVKGDYQKITYKQFAADINALGTELIARGFKGNNIAIIGDTNYTWSVANLAVVCGAGLVVPIDKELPYDDIKHIIQETASTAVFFGPRHEPFFTRMMAEGDTELKLLVAQSEHSARTIEEVGMNVLVEGQWELIESGKKRLENGDRSFSDAQIDSKAPAIILFTSGTTGSAKGIMLSNRNICADLMVSPTVLKVHSWDVFFSVLPIHHTYEYTCDFLMPLYKGACIAHCEGLKHIVKNLQEAHPTMFLGVPAIFEALHKQIWKGIKKKGKESAAQKGMKISRFGKKLGLDLSNLFFKEIKETLGGKMRMFISGGAAINPQILEDFQAFGIMALQGYGLSECAPIGALNPDTAAKSHSCGVALPSFGAKIYEPDEDGIGEICLQGENVMLGYYKRPDLTAEAIVDGWFHTGDIGYIDSEGYIVITGRKKNVIITKNGKNVFPEELEYQLALFDEISESMVFEDKAQEKDDTVIVASIYPDWEALKEILGEDAENDEKVKAHIQTLVDKVNESNPGYKMIRHILLRHQPLEKNTSNKVVRFFLGNKQAN